MMCCEAGALAIVLLPVIARTVNLVLSMMSGTGQTLMLMTSTLLIQVQVMGDHWDKKTYHTGPD